VICEQFGLDLGVWARVGGIVHIFYPPPVENCGFNSPLRFYNCMNSQLFVDYKSIAFYRVKACNEGGCSGYSNQVTGVYINGCQ
jgi:hypothetical protein